MKTRRLDAWLEYLRGAGLRLTPQRVALCRLVATSQEHPTAAQLYTPLASTFPSLSLATVYNTLNTLVAHGLVYELGNAGDGQMHYDPNTAPHVNLICVQCHRISDLQDSALESVSQHVAKRSGYAIQGARIAYYGICPACLKRHSVKKKLKRRKK